MHRFRLLVLSALLVPQLTGCSRSPRPAPDAREPVSWPAPLSARDADVLEAALRDSLRLASRDTTYFISLGSIENGWRDPPPGFLDRLKDIPRRIRPVSAARLPKPYEMETPTRYRGVEDPETAKRSWIYWAEIVQWVSDTQVRVNTGVWSGPLGGGGAIETFELRDGRWESTGAKRHWVS